MQVKGFMFSYINILHEICMGWSLRREGFDNAGGIIHHTTAKIKHGIIPWVSSIRVLHPEPRESLFAIKYDKMRLRQWKSKVTSIQR